MFPDLRENDFALKDFRFASGQTLPLPRTILSFPLIVVFAPRSTP